MTRRYATNTSRSVLRLLKFSPFQQTPAGRWRFGCKTISAEVVERLIASGGARVEGKQLIRVGTGK